MNAIELENATVIYQTDTGTNQALNSLSLNIKSGSWTTIIGRNGSGKSTLARVLARLLPTSRGKMRIAGEQQPQIVFQNPESGLIGETVFEDAAFGLSVQQVPADHIREKVSQVLRLFGLQNWIDKPVANLSGGQKQLLCIASCLTLNPDILIFDECTSMLDEGARQTVRQSVKKLQESGFRKTIIWVTQHLEELADANTVVALETGELAWQGSPRDFFYAGPGLTNPGFAAGGLSGSNTIPALSWCRSLGFTPPYVVQVAEHLRCLSGRQTFQPLTVAELVQGGYTTCPSN